MSGSHLAQSPNTNYMPWKAIPRPTVLVLFPLAWRRQWKILLGHTLAPILVLGILRRQCSRNQALWELSFLKHLDPYDGSQMLWKLHVPGLLTPNMLTESTAPYSDYF